MDKNLYQMYAQALMGKAPQQPIGQPVQASMIPQPQVPQQPPHHLNYDPRGLLMAVRN